MSLESQSVDDEYANQCVDPELLYTLGPEEILRQAQDARVSPPFVLSSSKDTAPAPKDFYQTADNRKGKGKAKGSRPDSVQVDKKG